MCDCVFMLFLFFFKQKTAYEMRISDWSSDVCSSDLPGCPHRRLRHLLTRALPHGLAPGASTFRPWASASFVGARHIFPCTLAAGDATATRRALQEELGAAEWTLPGHIVDRKSTRLNSSH